MSFILSFTIVWISSSFLARTTRSLWSVLCWTSWRSRYSLCQRYSKHHSCMEFLALLLYRALILWCYGRMQESVLQNHRVMKLDYTFVLSEFCRLENFETKVYYGWVKSIDMTIQTNILSALLERVSVPNDTKNLQRLYSNDARSL